MLQKERQGLGKGPRVMMSKKSLAPGSQKARFFIVVDEILFLIRKHRGKVEFLDYVLIPPPDGFLAERRILVRDK
jgi:hypothetical protein